MAYQQSVIEPGDPAGDVYPSAAPEHEHQWHDLVRVFLEGARAAAALGQAPERLALEVEPGVTMADELNSVAVHNAYHLGKEQSSALRQRIGAWPPTGAPPSSAATLTAPAPSTTSLARSISSTIASAVSSSPARAISSTHCSSEAS